MSPFANPNATFSAAHIIQSSSEISAAVLPIYEYQTYLPQGPANVWSHRTRIYEVAGAEGLYCDTNRRVDAIKWIQGIAWENPTKANQVYQYTYGTSFSITKGEEINLAFSASVSFWGFSVGFGIDKKTFSQTETTSTRTNTVTITVPPESHLVFYQKEYDFTDTTTFIADTDNQYYNIGSFGSLSPLTTITSSYTILANEYFTAVAPLRTDKKGTITLDAVTPNVLPSLTRKRETCSTRAKDFLKSLKI